MDVKCKNYPKLQLMTPSTEAFIVILYDNMVDVFAAQINYFKEKRQWCCNLPPRKENKMHPVYGDGKYTKRKSGTEKLGTFNAAGYKKWMNWRNMIKARREKDLDKMKIVDQAMMNSYRRKHNITASCHEAQLKKNNNIEVLEDDDLEQLEDDMWLTELEAV